MQIDGRLIGRRLSELRKQGGHSMASMARRSGVPRSYLYKLEGGQTQRPGVQVLDAIAQILNVPLAELIESGKPKARSRPKRTRRGLPPGLGEFIDQWEDDNDRTPMAKDTVRSLAAIQFSGRRPRRPADWRFIYDAISRSLAR
ncbi:MAG: helix-turn-helix transcriptional regulator [Gemmatimonadota bacterium]